MIEELLSKQANIKIFGKTKLFTIDELKNILTPLDIHLTDDLDKADWIVEGNAISMYDENILESVDKKIVFLKVFEQKLSSLIVPSSLLMSIKLSNNQERLKSFLMNPYITDELFLSLFKLHNWQKEDLFGNNENRDVSAAFIERFYEDIERNHLTQLSPLGFLHLINRTSRAEVIEAIYSIGSVNAQVDDDNPKNPILNIQIALGLNPHTPEKILEKLLQNSKMDVKSAAASNTNLSIYLQKIASKKEPQIRLALASNSGLSEELLFELLNDENIQIIETLLNTFIFDSENFKKTLTLLDAQRLCFIANNNSLTTKMLHTLFILNNESIELAIANNINLSSDDLNSLLVKENINLLSNLATAQRLEDTQVQKLLLLKNDEINSSLAKNIHLNKKIYEELYSLNKSTVSEFLAKNISTPLEILEQFQLDAILNRYVKENPTFTDAISQNIGWV